MTFSFEERLERWEAYNIDPPDEKIKDDEDEDTEDDYYNRDPDTLPEDKFDDELYEGKWDTPY